MIRLWTLGTLDLRHDDGDEVRAVLAQPRRLALLSYLGVAVPRGFHRRDKLLALFWADQEEDRGRASLNRACYFLRKVLGDDVLLSRGTDEIGLSDSRFWCDASAFGGLLEDVPDARAVALYRGDLLPGFYVSNAPAFESWLEGERQRLRDQAAAAAWALADREESAGNYAGAAQWARRGVELAPFTEARLRRLLVLLDRSGDRSAAVHAYERFRAQLGAELELSPSPETRGLIESIRARGEFPARETLVSDAVETTPPLRLASFTRDARSVDTPRPAIGGAGSAVTEPRRPDLETHASSSTGARVRSPPTRWRPVVLAVMGGIGGLMTGVVLLFAPRAEVDPALIGVEAFRNETNDVRADAVMRDAGDEVAASLLQTAAANTVVRVGSAMGSGWRTARAIVRRETLVPSTRPAIVVSGAITGERQPLFVRAWIRDDQRGGKVWPVTPVAVDPGSPAASIAEVRQRVLGGVAALRDAKLGPYAPIAFSPPTFEAYQEFAEGSTADARGALEEALRHYRWAVALDTTFTWPLVTGALTAISRGADARADSLLRTLATVRRRLPPLQRALLDYMLAVRVESWIAAHDAIREAARLVPERYSYLLAVRATHLNRPREAVEVLTRPGLDTVFGGGIRTYWLVLTLGLHQLGEHRTELHAARAARQRRPESASALAQEIRALAALGRVDAVGARLDTVMALPRDGWFTPAEAFVSSGVELRAHGQPDAAARAFARAIAWHRARPNEERSSEGRRRELGLALYAAERWDEADTIFRSLAAAHPDVADYVGPLGTIAARRGDRATAEAVAERLSGIERFAPVPGQDAIVWRARIAALLGDPDRSMRLLIDAFGSHGTAQIHGDIDFQRWENYPAFREFVRPKG